MELAARSLENTWFESPLAAVFSCHVSCENGVKLSKCTGLFPQVGVICIDEFLTSSDFGHWCISLKGSELLQNFLRDHFFWILYLELMVLPRYWVDEKFFLAGRRFQVHFGWQKFIYTGVMWNEVGLTVKHKWFLQLGEHNWYWK